MQNKKSVFKKNKNKKGKPKTKKINGFKVFQKKMFFKSFFLHLKVCLQKCFLQKDTCFSKQNVFKNTFTMLISPKKVFFLSLKRIKIYLLKKFFYHVKKMFVCFQNLFNIVIFLCTLISSLFLE